MIRYAIISAMLGVVASSAQAEVRGLKLLGEHNAEAVRFGSAEVVFVAADFSGDHSYADYSRAFQDACRLSGRGRSAYSHPSSKGNQDIQLSDRKAVFGWYVLSHPEVSYWFGVEVVANESRFIDKNMNGRKNGGFYGSNFAPEGCRSEVAGGSVFCQFADNDRNGVVFRFNYTEPSRR